METDDRVKRFFIKYKKYWICYSICWIVLIVLILMLQSGNLHFGCKGIVIDQAGNIYVGLTEEIRVFDENGHLLRTVSPKTSKSYVFAVENEKLLVDAASTSYIMDLNGNVLSVEQYPQLPYIMKTPSIIQINNKVYHVFCSNFYYRVVVENNGNERIAVQTPTIDLIAEIVFISTIVFIFISLVFMLRSRNGNTVCKER